MKVAGGKVRPAGEPHPPVRGKVARAPAGRMSCGPNLMRSLRGATRRDLDPVGALRCPPATFMRASGAALHRPFHRNQRGTS